MRRYSALAAGTVVVAIAAAWLYSRDRFLAGPATPASADIVAGERLYAENCASCHGAKLEGQPDWKSTGADGRLPAPPHDKTGHTWHHGDGVLFSYTKLGGKQALARQGVDFESGMPGFSDTLSDRQIWDILAYIKSTWPARQRDVQAARTAAEGLEGDVSR